MAFKLNCDRRPTKIKKMKLDIRKARKFLKPPRRAWEAHVFRAKALVAQSRRCHRRRRQGRGFVSRTCYKNAKGRYKALRAENEALELENRQFAGKIAMLEDQLARLREVIEDVFDLSEKRRATADHKQESGRRTFKREGFDQEALDQWVMDQEELDTAAVEYLSE